MMKMVKKVSILNQFTEDKLPKHIAIIMDGNGRWAQNKGKMRSVGHKEGVKVLEKILIKCKEIGIKYLTVYAFSVENWKRPHTEIKILMSLFEKYLKNKENKFLKEGVRLVVSGLEENISHSLLNQIKNTTEKLKNCNNIVLNIAFNYSGRTEIIEAMKKVSEKKLDFTEENIKNNLYNSFIPYPDLVIRTGGEYRISNFLIWQIAYSEIYITKILWPDFDELELEKAIEEYMNRNRRYGGL